MFGKKGSKLKALPFLLTVIAQSMAGFVVLGFLVSSL